MIDLCLLARVTRCQELRRLPNRWMTILVQCSEAKRAHGLGQSFCRVIAGSSVHSLITPGHLCYLGVDVLMRGASWCERRVRLKQRVRAVGGWCAI